MKKFLFIPVIFLVGACGINEENRKNMRVNLENGKELNLLVFEKKSFITQAKTLMIYANEHFLTNKNCDAADFKKFGDKLFFETIKQNDLPIIKSGKIHLALPQASPDKPYCIYSYAKKDNGEWITEN